MSAKTAKPQTPRAPTGNVASIQVSLPQMLDLALGTPEVGAVNLNILHNFLHVLLHQINLRSTKVEYRGDDANRIKTMVSSLKAGPTLHLHEYSITDGSGKVKQRIQSTDIVTVNVDVVKDERDVQPAKTSKTSVSAPATEREKGGEGAHEAAGGRKTKGVKQKIGPGTEGECETVIFVEPIVDGATPTALGFKKLEESVKDLQHRFQFLEELATDSELVDRVKGKTADPLTDVWQIINITKRLDASEQGIDKLTKMVQDVIKSERGTDSGDDMIEINERLKNLEVTLLTLDETVNNLKVLSEMQEEEPPVPPTDSKPEIVDTATAVDEPPKPQATQRVSLTKLLGGIDVKELHADVTALKTQVSEVRNRLNDLNENVAKLSTDVSAVATATAETQKEAEPVEEKKPEEADESTETNAEAVEQGELIHADVVQEINERIEKLEKEVVALTEKVDSAPVPDVSGDNELTELVSKIQGIQSDMEKLNETADRLIDDRENREVHLNALLEQIELLKTIKADKEDLEDALADKADAQVLNRKVSYDQFDAACDDLARGLEDAIGKLGKQESIWQQALDEVQREIEGKVDKIEISPLRDFVTNRLKSLQDKLKGISEMRREAEAAGTKKMLRDVQCISCDKNVVMKMEDTNKFHADPLPCSMSMKPYLTYELDQVRKQQRRLPHSRNMIQFEAALQDETKKQRSARMETLVKTPRDHLCNRYCGGSHTVTTPQQRVTRMGHYLSQWGPEIVQLTEGMIKGTDGKMYRSRPMPGKFDVCGPAYCDVRTDEEVRPSDRPAPAAATASASASASASATPATLRKSVEKRPSTSSKKRSSKKISNEVTVKEAVVESVVLPAAEVEETAQKTLTTEHAGHGDQIILYEEIEEGDEEDV